MYKYKPILFFCSLLLSFSLFLSFGSVKANAALDNLIDSNLVNWNCLFPDVNEVKKAFTYNGSTTYLFITFPQEVEGVDDTYVNVGCIYELPDLVSGNSYTFSFDILSLEQVVSSGGSASFNSMYYGFENSGATLHIGLASYSSSNDWINPVEDCSVVIDKSNYLDYFGHSNKITFEVPNIVNPCIYIYYGETDNKAYNTYIYFSNILLVDNDAESEAGFFDTLFQFFHDLRWDVTGGTCDKEDCIKKNHTSLAGRINSHIDDLPQAFTEGIKSLFVPSEDFLSEFKEKMDAKLTQHLGVVYQSSKSLATLFESVYQFVDGSDAGGKFYFPSLSFDLNFGREENYKSYDIDLYDGSDSVDFSFLNDEGSFWYTFYNDYYKVILYVIFSGALLFYAYNVFDRIMR